MNISAANIQPSPTPQAPPAQTSSKPANAGDFSQQLSRARAKGGQGSDPNAQQAQTNSPSSSSDTQDASATSARDKGKSKQQQKQGDQTKETDQTNQPDHTTSASQTELEARAQQAEGATQANLAGEAQKAPKFVRQKASSAPSKTSGKQTKDDPTPQTPANAAGDVTAKQTVDTSANAAAMQAVAASQQPAPVNTKTAAPANANDGSADGTGVKQMPAKAKVSPFMAQTAQADQAAGQASAQTAAKGATDAAAQADASAQTAQLPAKEKPPTDGSAQSPFAQLMAQTPALASGGAHVAAPQQAQPQTPTAQFAEVNQPTIVSTIHGRLLPDGGTMSISLNPPDLGAMQISVKMENGVMSASFQTSTDQATKLLTHTLGQLKNALEIQGVSVDRLHVQQASGSEGSSGKGSDSENSGQQSQQDGRSAQQEEQRRETLRRMWRKIRGQGDPLDLVA